MPPSQFSTHIKLQDPSPKHHTHHHPTSGGSGIHFIGSSTSEMNFTVAKVGTRQKG